MTKPTRKTRVFSMYRFNSFLQCDQAYDQKTSRCLQIIRIRNTGPRQEVQKHLPHDKTNERDTSTLFIFFTASLMRLITVQSVGIVESNLGLKWGCCHIPRTYLLNTLHLYCDFQRGNVQVFRQMKNADFRRQRKKKIQRTTPQT